MVTKCPNAVQWCVSVTTARTASATSIWATTNVTSPTRLHRRYTSPYHMPYRKKSTSSTNEVTQVWYHGPAMIHGTRKKCSERPHPPLARSSACSTVSARP